MANEPKPAVIVETIPSTEGGISAIASSNAPIIFFDNSPNFGYYNGIAHITLTAMRFLPTSDAKATQDQVIVAHLRMNMMALKGLKAAIEGIEKIIEKPASDALN